MESTRMVKKQKMDDNKELDTGKEFMEFWKKLSPENQMFLDGMGINSFPKLVKFAALMGIDFDKMVKFAKEHSDMEPENVPFENFMLSDEDNPFAGMLGGILGGEDGEYDDESMDGNLFDFPEKCFIGDECVEYHLRIKLNNAPLPIWREFKVPSNVTLEYLSFIINEVMGWEGTHLHQYKQKDTFYKTTYCLEESANMFFFSRFKEFDTNDYTIAHLLKEKGDRIKYEYDFGDSWEHDLWLKGVREYADGESHQPMVIKGKGACPPEDCGGVWGYAELLEVFKKKRKTAEEKERLLWYFMDRNFLPEEYDTEEAQYALEELWEMATA